MGNGGWTGDWLWGLPMITLSLTAHVIGLTLIAAVLTKLFGGTGDRIGSRRHPTLVFVTAIGLTAWCLAALHGLEAGLWAACYLWLSAVPNYSNAMLYSLDMMTTVGAAVVGFKLHWQLLGRLEAVCGMLLFGLSTAFMFAVLQRVWPHVLRPRGARTALQHHGGDKSDHLSSH